MASSSIRAGLSEAVSAAAVSMAVNGIFALDPDIAYSGGNSTYLSVPISALLSLLIMLALVSAMRANGAASLDEMFSYPFGRVFGLVLALPLIAGLILCSVRPLFAFAQVLHRLVYDGVEFSAILLFILPVTVFMVFRGPKTVLRTAKCMAFALLLSLAVSILSAASGFKVYRLYPVMGDGLPHMLLFSCLQTSGFLPPLLALTALSDEQGGLSFARRSGVRAALSASAVCAAAHLAIALCFRAGMLSELLMPLFRIGSLEPRQSFIVRLDKLFIMLWLSGAIVSAAYCMSAASGLLSRLSGAKSPLGANCAISAALIAPFLLVMRADMSFLDAFSRAVAYWSAPAIILPMMICALAGAVKKRRCSV